MAFHLRILSLTFFLLTPFTAGDDSAVMTKLSASLSPAPPSWTGNNFCKWDGITCDNSNRVTSINLQSKSLTGTLPSDINQLSQLQTLAVQRNSISGDLPTLANLTHLGQIFLHSNNFVSIPPDFFFGLNSLQTVSISDNQDLSPWILPETLNQSTNLHSFLASNAKITGPIPEIFDRLLNLQNLRLSYNNLTGNLPESFAGSQIQNLWLNNQLLGLSGTLDVISSMTQLNQVWLHVNSFTGVIPDLSNCSVLFDLQIRDNQLTGLVPQSLMFLPKLANISLRNNKLQGQLPVFRSGVLAELGIKTNSFCLSTPGPCDPQVTSLLEIAGEIGFPMLLAQSWKGNDACQNWNFISCDASRKNVTIVTFVKLNFSGSISPAFANLTSLRILSLNDNNLVGSIPEILTSLPNLQLLDVSNNNLSGPIPVFPPRVKFLHSGNRFLGQNVSNGSGQNVSGGPPGYGSGSGNMGGSGSSSGKTKMASVSSGIVAGIVIGAVVIIVIVLLVSYECYLVTNNQNPRHVRGPDRGLEMVNAGVMGGSNPQRVGGLQSDQGSSVHTEMSVSEGGNVAISIQVLRAVTDNFSEENVLGKGGFAVVYRGTFNDGTKVAVKRMNSGEMGTKGLKEFQAEIAALTEVRHRHLVALLGYCIDGNERLLVYEYMSQGTLSQHLFEWKERKTSPLSWKQRVSVALDVARGVEYLHSLALRTFIHRDLKPSNILLDDNMRAKVADFGLLKNAPDATRSVQTSVAGTIGYLEPEYANTGRVTTKADVYAFGVILMELITGRKATDATVPENERPLVTWFRGTLVSKENIINASDQTLDKNKEETVESICKVAKLARHCAKPEQHQRPDMGHVVTVLGPLVDQWKPSQPAEDEDDADMDGVGTSRTVDDSRGEASLSRPRNP